MRHRLMAVCGCAVLLATSACGGGEDDGGPREVTAGVIAIVDVAPIYLGKEQGFFEKRGIDLKLEIGSGGAAAVPGVVSGNFEFAFGNVTSLLVARDENLPLKVIANGVNSNGKEGGDFSAVVVPEDSPVKGPEDLEGKTVSANNLKNIGDTTVRNSVREAGGDPAAVDFVEMGLPEMSPALDKGQIDAAWVVEPFVSIALKDGHREIASNYAEFDKSLTVATYFTSEQMLAEEPELMEDIAAALEESMAYADENPDEVRRIIGSYTEIEPALIDDMRLPRFQPEVDRDSVQKVADLARKDGLLEKAADVDELYR
ncbi:NitT/TauT family transport system substrate-binding protein [Murinocardiopsis flavida]|uniref:NitT/TauT family transport system substrate-binding protein n=1 Tax=Murinocardiopsis flavida TaxID=645275 RepID=A0A2P8DNV3_9ACTN|nr:ABC transporter substrate-binding protein [Murinocardiopsis flavida]PSK98879.1 NitT/TauT family transport system substrate-binding protein [Murinocardiopsis flavida]